MISGIRFIGRAGFGDVNDNTNALESQAPRLANSAASAIHRRTKTLVADPKTADMWELRIIAAVVVRGRSYWRRSMDSNARLMVQ